LLNKIRNEDKGGLQDFLILQVLV